MSAGGKSGTFSSGAGLALQKTPSPPTQELRSTVIRTTLALAAALAVAATAPAGAAPREQRPDLPPPAGKIEHVVLTESFDGNFSVDGVVPRTLRTELWITADAAHSVVTDVKTGTLRSETAQWPGGMATFDAPKNEIWESEPAPGIVFSTQAEEGAYLKRSVAKGWMRVTGQTTHQGRPAITLESTGTSPTDIEDARQTVIADATTYAPLERTMSGRDRGRTFTQVSKVEKAELLELAGNEHLLKLGDHPGAGRVTAEEQQARADAAAAKARKAREAKARKAKARKAARAKRAATSRKAARR